MLQSKIPECIQRACTMLRMHRIFILVLVVRSLFVYLLLPSGRCFDDETGAAALDRSLDIGAVAVGGGCDGEGCSTWGNGLGDDGLYNFLVEGD
jgi:hypothetical protein